MTPLNLNKALEYGKTVDDSDNLYSIISDRSEHFVRVAQEGMMVNGLNEEALE
jgi:hypothetical protein